MIKNKKKILTRILATAFAVAFAVLPLGLFSAEKNKVTASAESFSETVIDNDSWLNPLSFFDFSVRRPAGDWAYMNSSNYVFYDFSLPQYMWNADFLRSNGNSSLDTVFAYLPLYSGSVRYDLVNGGYPVNGRLFSSFPHPYPNSNWDEIGEREPVHMARVFIVDKLVPLKVMLSWLDTNLNFGFSSNLCIASAKVVCMRINSDGETYFPSYSWQTPDNEYIVADERDSGFYMEDILSSIIPVDDISSYLKNLVFRVNQDYVYIEHLYLDFYYDDSYYAADVFYDSFGFSYFMPDSNLMITRQKYNWQYDDFFDTMTGIEPVYVELKPFDSILAVVTDFFDMELFPGFKMSYLLYVSVAGLVIGFAIKIFLQG